MFLIIIPMRFITIVSAIVATIASTGALSYPTTINYKTNQYPDCSKLVATNCPSTTPYSTGGSFPCSTSSAGGFRNICTSIKPTVFLFKW